MDGLWTWTEALILELQKLRYCVVFFKYLMTVLKQKNKKRVESFQYH